jgi:hypothetical protein
VSWFKVDDGFHDHPKVHALAEQADQRFPLCVAIWTLSGCYAGRHETDGLVTIATLRRLVPGSSREELERAALDLVAVGLWERDGESYLFHDWADYQPTREEKAEKREQDRARQARSRGARQRSRASQRGGGVTGAMSQRDSGVTRAEHAEASRVGHTPPSRPSPSQPSPARPDPSAPSRAREPARAPDGSATGRSHDGNKIEAPGPRGSATATPKRNPRVGQADPDTNFAGGEVRV